MFDLDPPIPLAAVARAAYLRAGGTAWEDIAEKLARTVTETEAMERHPDWARLHALAVAAVANEAEAEARLELRRALRSDDEDEATAAAEEAYRRQERRDARRESGPPAPPSDDDQLVRSYLDFLNALSAEEFRAMEAASGGPAPAGLPGPNVTAG